MEYTDVATINRTLKRAKEEGLGISETALRRWVRDGTLYAAYSGRQALVYWPNVLELVSGHSGS